MAAKEALTGFPFYEKPMKIQFAREDADAIAKEKGTYVDREPKYLSQKVVKKPKNKKRDNGGDGPAPPNKILFCTNLPDTATAEMLEIMFNQCVFIDFFENVSDFGEFSREFLSVSSIFIKFQRIRPKLIDFRRSFQKLTVFSQFRQIFQKNQWIPSNLAKFLGKSVFFRKFCRIQAKNQCFQ